MVRSFFEGFSEFEVTSNRLLCINFTLRFDSVPVLREVYFRLCERDGFEVMPKRLGRDACAYCLGYNAFVRMPRPELADKLAAVHPWLNRE